MKKNSHEPLATAQNFAFPYPRLLMEGHLNITGEPNSGVKTSRRFFNPKPDQHIFIRTSGNQHPNIVQRHGLTARTFEKQLKGMNGVAVLSEVRELETAEQLSLFCAFNDLPEDDDSKRLFKGKERLAIWEPSLDFPLEYGLFFKDIRPFPQLVKHEIAPGAINFVKVARTEILDKALESVGLSWKDMLPKR